MINSQDVLVIQTAFVGDLLLSIPLLREVKVLYPDGRIVVVCRAGLGDFLLRSGAVDEVIEIKKGRGESGWTEAAAAIEGRTFDLVLIPHQSFRSYRFALKARARLKIGYKRWFNVLGVGARIERPIELPEALRQLALLAPIDPVWNKRIEDYKATGQARAGGQLAADQLAPVPAYASMRLSSLNEAGLKDPGGINKKRLSVVLAPGSVWETKKWTIEGYAGVARELLQAGAGVTVIGAPSEKPICDRLAELAPGVQVIAGQTSIYESTRLIAGADLIICNDSGAMHMAACAGTPIVALFGPTVLEFGYRPWQDAAVVVQRPMACRPCGKHGGHVCPLGTHACMREISSAEVLAAAKRLLSQTVPNET